MVTDTNAVENVFQQHGFVTLSIGLDGIKLAVLNYDSKNIAACEVIAFRESNGEGMTLKDEVTLLSKTLPQIRHQLILNPHLLSSAFHHKTISLLGKKVSILCDGEGHPLRGRLQPLILLEQDNQQSNNSNSTPQLLPSVVINQLDNYLQQHFTENAAEPTSVKSLLNPLRRSYKFLGGIPLILLPLLGLAGLLFSFGWYAMGTVAGIFSVFISTILLLTAISSLRDFQRQNIFTIRIDSQERSPIAKEQASRLENPASAQVIKEIPRITEREPRKTWNMTTIAAFLHDSIESAMIGTLNSYKTENWNAFILHLRTLIINGVRLSILKHSGQEPPEQLDQILQQIPYPDVCQDLEAWLQRLVITNHSTTLNLAEAQTAANFAVFLLKRVQILPSNWEDRIFCVVPRRTPLRSRVNNETPTPSSLPPPQSTPAPSVSLASSPETMIAPTTTIQPAVTNGTPKEPDQIASEVSTAKAVSGVPLRVDSKAGMDDFVKLMKAGASPYLLVFANRFLGNWINLSKLIDQIAESMGSQVNVVVFPVLGDSKIYEEIKTFIDCFHTERYSSLSPLPFILAVNLTVLIHIIEDEMPVPSELIVSPHPENFIQRIQESIAMAQAYQINPESLDVEEDEKTLHTSFITLPKEIPVPDCPTGNPSSDSPKSITIATPELIADTDDVVEEVASASVSSSNRKVMEVDIVAARERRELATMVPVALAVVHLPEDQSLLDTLDVVAQQEEYLVAQFVDLACFPEASELLKIPRCSIRLRFNGTEQLLERPEAENLLASLRQLRAIKNGSSQISHATSVDSSSQITGQMELPETPQQSPSKQRKQRRIQQKKKQSATQL